MNRPSDNEPNTRPPSPGGSCPDPGITLYFDGVCGLCNRFVDILLHADTRGILRFAPLQGSTALEALPPEDVADLDSIVLVDGKGRHYRSEAVLLGLGHLGGAWRLLALLRVIPRGLRDMVYRAVASNRYAIFGKRDICRIPTPEERERFLP